MHIEFQAFHSTEVHGNPFKLDDLEKFEENLSTINENVHQNKDLLLETAVMPELDCKQKSEIPFYLSTAASIQIVHMEPLSRAFTEQPIKVDENTDVVCLDISGNTAGEQQSPDDSINYILFREYSFWNW